jgi:SagB-type dehydrogenase family enzyme
MASSSRVETDERSIERPGLTRRTIVTGAPGAVVAAILLVGCDQHSQQTTTTTTGGSAPATAATTEDIATATPTTDDTTTATPTTAASAPTATGRATPLPSPRTTGTFTLDAALAQRRSRRSFAPTPLSTEELSQLLWAAQGITQSPNLRTAPSAGALYPLKVYAVTAGGTHRYEPNGHALVPQVAGDKRPAIKAAALDQTSIGEAPLVLVITAIYAISAARYGEELAVRYSTLEVGHVAQNVLLEVVALGLGAVPIGPIDLDGIRTALALGADETPAYIIRVGHAR